MLDTNRVKTTVDRLFSDLVTSFSTPEAHKSVGLLVGVTIAGQRYYFSFGQVDLHEGGSAAIEDIVFFIGSNTKVITATLLALAAREAANPVTPFTHIQDLVPTDISVKQPYGDILLWHLATHSAGYPDGVCGPRPAFGNYPFTSMGQFLANFDPSYAPGKYWVYSNQGFALLGVLLSHAYAGRGSSSSWDDTYRKWPSFAVDKVTSPLGMETTQVDYSHVARRVAQGYNYVEDNAASAYKNVPPPNWVFNSAGLGAGALSSTLADMLTFLEAEITPPYGSLGTALKTTQQAYPDSDVLSMGLGWQLSNGYLDKNGGLGGNQTYMAFDPTTKIGVFVFGNTSGGDAGGVLTKTGRILLGELRGFPAEPSVFPQPQSVPQCP
jgi:CubicO group peptidase (beta-lactamase class C family)